jgi:hypothetical protein
VNNLVIARVGTTSLHPHWFDPEAPRNWDLRLCPYQPIAEPADVIPGPKWAGLRELLNTWEGWRSYDYIWLPDDDIATTQAAINQLFDVAATASMMPTFR